MKITCYIVDDEPDAIALLEDYISAIPELELIGTSRYPLEALDVLAGPDAPDLAFIDVDMRLLTGLELAGMNSVYTAVIFTTAFNHYAAESYEKKALDYLLKPISRERFLRCIQLVKNKRQETEGRLLHFSKDFFLIKTEVKGRLIKVKYSEVMYIESALNYVTIHTIAGKHMAYLTMKEIQGQLPRGLFQRIHRFSIVNIDYVNMIERNRVIMEGGQDLMMGDHYKDDFLTLMAERLIKSQRGM